MLKTVKPAIYLGIDTTTSYLCLALWSPEEGKLKHFEQAIERGHAKRILPELNTLLEKVNLTKAHLAGIGVGIGPGSYTGLRIGIATAKGLAKGLKLPLVGGSSLAAIAYRQLRIGEQGLIAIQAGRGNVYAGVYKKEANIIQNISNAQKYSREELLAKHPQFSLANNQAPDASYLAQLALYQEERPIQALYL